MTARTARRISQPDSRCVPNRNAVLNKKNVVALPRLPHSRCVPNRNAVLNKNNVVVLPRLPLAQLQPRKHCRETSAARIRKAGRILTAPLPQLQPWLFSTKTGSTRHYHLRSFIRATHCRESPSRPESERPVGA